MHFVNTWDLESIFPGGTKSPALKEKLEMIKGEMKEYENVLNEWKVNEASSSIATFKTLLEKQEKINKSIKQVNAFIKMWHDAYMNDDYANVMKGHVMNLDSMMQKLDNSFTKKLVSITETDWKNLLEDEALKETSFALYEIRDQGKRLLSEEEEKIIADLNKDGLAAWSGLYDTIVSVMTIPFTSENGERIELSVGQAMTRMYADPNPQVRKQLFSNWKAAWQKYAPVFADTINHLSGYRLTLQHAHHRIQHLEEPLEDNRMSRGTLDAMWSAVSKNKQPFIDFLHRKAELLGMEKLGWQDVEAPVVLGNMAPTHFTYGEACDFIIEHFASFGSELADFAKYALENRWVEAEDRPNKRPGGYCTSLPEFEESRIFMTFTGSPIDISTLAHELGHAFHSYVMKGLPELNRQYPMNVAETASTFAETIIGNATVEHATSTEERIALLDAKIESATAMFFNIHARFLFEDKFYTERVKGIVSENRLNELMVEAQKEAFGDSLATYHPHFWCSKLHFFMDRVPFYNFPYTFGYLFSLGIYAEYRKHPVGFEEKYIDLLKDTGSMAVEDLAKKHLGVDLTEQTFWEAGIQLMIKDVEEFRNLTADLENK